MVFATAVVLFSIFKGIPMSYNKYPNKLNGSFGDFGVFFFVVNISCFPILFLCFFLFVCESASVYISCAFYLALFPIVSFVLLWFAFIFKMPDCILMRKRWKCRELGRM